MNTFNPFLNLAGRVFIAAIFLLSGINKISAFEGTQGYMEAFGVPGALLPLVIAFEIIAALAIIAGFKTRIAALALAVFTLATAVVFHSNFADQAEFISFMKNLAITGGFLFLATNGPGGLSLDDRLANTRQPAE